MKSNKYLQYVFLFIAFFGLFYVFFNASIGGIVFPFAFGLLFALAWTNQKVWLLVPAYILASVATSATLNFSICNLVCVFCLLVPYFVHILAKKNFKKWELFIYALLSQTAQIVFYCMGGISAIVMVSHLVFGLLFMFVCTNVFEAFIVRGFSNKLTILEIISLFAIIAVFCAGMTAFHFDTFSLLKLFASFTILVFAYCSGPFLTILVASVSALGSLVATNNAVFFAPFVLWALAVIVFKKRQRIFMGIALVLVEVVIGLYFKLYYTFDIYSILPLLISSVVFVLVPSQLLNGILSIFNLTTDRLAVRNVANRNREILHKRLGNLSEVFNEMNLIYRNLLKTSMSFEDVKDILQQEIKGKICSFCPERNHCHRTFADSTKQVFDQLIKVGYERGRATLLDIPSYLTSRCKQTNAILGSVNTLTNQYKKYLSMVKDVDTSKLIIADQLQGVSKIMRELSQEVESSITFDIAKESKIMDELTYYNIVCIDVVVFEKDVYTMEVSVVVKKEDAEKKRISDVVSKVCGKKMFVYENFSASRPGYALLILKTAPQFDCVFGVSQKTKNGSNVSGDSYSIVKLDGDKILFAISDGMGSGEKAEKASELSIDLVENFYRAGFDNDLILSTVNKLLNLHKEEIFSALDLCVIDQRNGLVDFIKMASPSSFILNDRECTRVETGALPIGIVEETTPLVNKNIVENKDFIIMISDGISDSFEGEEELKECIKSIKTKNPQEFAEELLERALACNNGYAVDDMTVIVVKILNFQD